MREARFLIVSEDIAERAGVKDLRSRTADGRYVLYEGDMRLVHLQPEEYATGIQGVEVITEARAQELVEQAKALAAEEKPAVVPDDNSDEIPEETPDETPEVIEENDNVTNEEETDDGTDEPSE